MDDEPAIDEPSTLEVPTAAEDLYYAVGDDAPASRPLLTGDVVAGVSIPGLEDGAGYGIVMTHPCAMRKDGVLLADRIFVARVREYQNVQLSKWASSHFKVMPLPGLPGSFQVQPAAMFNEASLVRSDALKLSGRVACLSEYGINLLQQRLVYHLTRFAVPTPKLHQVSAQVFREVELQEEWVTAAIDGEVDVLTAQKDFHEWLRSTDGDGQATKQARLLDAQQVAGIRREMRSALKGRYPAPRMS